MNTQNGSGRTTAGADADTVPTSIPSLGGGFGVALNRIERIAVLAVSGDVDMVTAPALADAIQAAAAEQPLALIVDFTEVEFLGSAGMTVLITAHRNMVLPMRFAVVADGPTTSRPLNVIGVDTIVTVYRTLDEALADFT